MAKKVRRSYELNLGFRYSRASIWATVFSLGGCRLKSEIVPLTRLFAQAWRLSSV